MQSKKTLDAGDAMAIILFQWARKTKKTSTELLDTAVRRGVAGGYVGGEPMATAAPVSSSSRRWARGGRSGR